MDAASAGEGGLRPIAVLVAGATALFATGVAIAWLADSPTAPVRLEKMGCRELAVEVLEGSEATRRAALEIFERKKCL